MRDFWRTRNGINRVSLSVSRFFRLLCEDVSGLFMGAVIRAYRIPGLRSIVKNFGQTGDANSSYNTASIIPLGEQNSHEQIVNHQVVKGSKPVIFVSACVDKNLAGDWKYSGGIKELNYLVKLLRKHGYEAYMVTYYGSYEPWLIEHQPHISIEEFRLKLKSTTDVRCVTSYAIAKAFIDECKQLYFWDMELWLTENTHFPILASLYKNEIKRVAGISRTIQAWHMANFEKPCTLLPNLIDDSFWFPIEAERQHLKVGYMDEGSHTEEYLNVIQNASNESGFNLNFHLLKGGEAEVLSGMRSCEVFLTMNTGKDPLWGEGGPLTPLEALSTGCISIAFDIVGPREIIQSGFNGIIVTRYRPDLMANALLGIYKKTGEIERLRKNALSLIESCHTFEARWPAVKEFLELNED